MIQFVEHSLLQIKNFFGVVVNIQLSDCNGSITTIVLYAVNGSIKRQNILYDSIVNS